MPLTLEVSWVKETGFGAKHAAGQGCSHLLMACDYFAVLSTLEYTENLKCISCYPLQQLHEPACCKKKKIIKPMSLTRPRGRRPLEPPSLLPSTLVLCQVGQPFVCWDMMRRMQTCQLSLDKELLSTSDEAGTHWH